ncbi:hypothetical protein T07_438 [Trichinella nelsoni]|uniref:Uncharacterized protein n=1 Tax=Trichinella nelsoni TaxID=6336 RepID=A0A0V0RC40_9BILA|nr:hypothetical protein T07_438 [Trichinella nelsoni]
MALPSIGPEICVASLIAVRLMSIFVEHHVSSAQLLRCLHPEGQMLYD